MNQQEASGAMLAHNESTSRPFKEKKILRRKKNSVDPHNASQSLLKSAVTHRSKRNISNNLNSSFSLYGLNSTGSKAALSPPPGHLKKMADINNFQPGDAANKFYDKHLIKALDKFTA